MSQVCEHGSLKRQCLTCELEAELASLREERDRLRNALKQISEWPRTFMIGSEDMRNIAAAALAPSEGKERKCADPYCQSYGYCVHGKKPAGEGEGER